MSNIPKIFWTSLMIGPGGYGYQRAADPNMVDNYMDTLETNAKEGINGGNAVIAAIVAQEEETRSEPGSRCGPMDRCV